MNLGRLKVGIFLTLGIKGHNMSHGGHPYILKKANATFIRRGKHIRVFNSIFPHYVIILIVRWHQALPNTVTFPRVTSTHALVFSCSRQNVKNPQNLPSKSMKIKFLHYKINPKVSWNNLNYEIRKFPDHDIGILPLPVVG